MMHDFKDKADNLLVKLKRERSIKNSEQAIEIVSLFLVIRFFEIICSKEPNKNAYSQSGLHSLRNHEDYFYYYKNVINEVACSHDYMSRCPDIEKLLISSIENTILKLNNSIVIEGILQLTSLLTCRDDFEYLSKWYRSILERMSIDSGKTGEFYTPDALSKVIVRVLKPESRDKVYDPACGTGGFLVTASGYTQGKENNDNSYLVGGEISPFAYLTSFASLLFKGDESFSLRLFDSLDIGTHCQKYNIVLTNPPFGKYNHSSDYYPQDFESSYVDYQFLNHVMNSLEVGGRAAIVLPDRFFTDRSSSGIALKKRLLSDFNINCILSIPPGAMLPYTGVKLSVLFFSNESCTSDIWIYQLNTIERFTKKSRISIEHFDDFFDKLELKELSKNSWFVNRNELGDSFNLLFRKNDRESYGVLINAKINLDKLSEINQEMIESLKYTKDRISRLEDHIRLNISNYHLKSYKVEELVSSLPSKPLSRSELKEEGIYPVYGGNGVIGYYDNFHVKGSNIVIGRVGALCGNVRYVSGNIWATNNALVLESKLSDKVHVPYLAKVLEMKDLRKLASGTAQPHITFSKIKNIEVDLPPLNVQIELDTWLTELELELEKQELLAEKISQENKILKNKVYLNLLRT
ncbi:N-6 DNA methylase [Psychromonas sp. Urea-02u-13]|uniref:N-6 DNA methylase n=1 Tax=Psychromonas sp. Urea-02u-13 TaxID=2058326 RepID=UPI000C31E6A3|nr:N-6 DNA methylase [Psychromonas sp. Urea-02u-13]PKG37647.1 hypothetical protein CXF74_17680 [Psychromonas sp. Urea-02u-13]